MSDNLQNVNDLMAEIEGIAIRTSAGTFVKTEDVRRLAKKRFVAEEIEDKAEPAPKTVEQARVQAKKFLAEQQELPAAPLLGKAIPASEPQPSSRT